MRLRGAAAPAASIATFRPGLSDIELAELEGAILRLRQSLGRSCAERSADQDGADLSLTAHFLNLAPSTTDRLRLWMGLCTETSTELLGDPLAHLRPVDTLEAGVAARLLDRMAERLGIPSQPC